MTTIENRQAAARLLVNCSALSHNPHIAKHVDLDGNRIAWDELELWRWSTGERVLLELLRFVVLGHSNLELGQLYQLDQDNRDTAASALKLLFRQAGEPVIW